MDLVERARPNIILWLATLCYSFSYPAIDDILLSLSLSLSTSIVMALSEDFDLPQQTSTLGYNTAAQNSGQGDPNHGGTPIYEKYTTGEDSLTPVTTPRLFEDFVNSEDSLHHPSNDELKIKHPFSQSQSYASDRAMATTAPLLFNRSNQQGQQQNVDGGIEPNLPFHSTHFGSTHTYSRQPPDRGQTVSAPIRCATDSEIGEVSHFRSPSEIDGVYPSPNLQTATRQAHPPPETTGWQSALGPALGLDEKRLEQHSGSLSGRMCDKEANHDEESGSEFGKSVSSDAKRRKCFSIIVGLLSVVCLLLLGAVIFFGVREQHQKNSSIVEGPKSGSNMVLGDSGSNSAYNGGTGSTGIISQIHSPSDITTGREHIYSNDTEVHKLLNNPQLHNAFYGISYSPRNARYPACTTTQREVTLDIAVLSQLTNRVRLYGTDCNAVAYVLNAIEDLGLNMTVSLGIWIANSPDVSLRQIDAARHVLTHYPARHFDSVLLGNEALFRKDVDEGQLIGYIDYFKDFMRSKNLTHIPVGTSEIGSLWTNNLAKHVDVLAANIHPFFGGVPVNDSTKWTYDFLFRHVVQSVSPYDGQLMISEVGWPSGGGNFQGARAGRDELQTFLDTWLCTNKDSDVGWYWFEAYDASWKAQWNTPQSEWETQWGLLTEDRQLKDIVLPLCV